MFGFIGRGVIYGLAAIGAAEVYRRYCELRARAAAAERVAAE